MLFVYDDKKHGLTQEGIDAFVAYMKRRARDNPSTLTFLLYLDPAQVEAISAYFSTPAKEIKLDQALRFLYIFGSSAFYIYLDWF